ncbi:cupin domain-containing protein [Leptolyngbya sp. FACHB-261]|uniref:cupin domain-containing protein n=1 Tax=Leptolyngbya sp. FACHB-261 TaxID=2692806 RepID=UPI001682901F|nr:cupin domain-containing protein [Leptolyngbya sp. FACHB-261]MBD2102256.1 cupin domain-containing protein [Leptolyngbya sp. FACHB-261]
MANKVIHLAEVAPVPVTHDPQLLKRVLLKDSDTQSNLKMLNHTAMAVGESFRSHSHPTMEEVFYFLEGQGHFSLADQTLKVGPGDCVYVPCATSHACINVGDQPLVFLSFGVAL